MNEFMENKISEEELNEVTGGVGASEVKVRPITPIWVRVTSSSLNCRYTPNGEIAKIYEKGHKLKVDGITADGEWYRTIIINGTGRKAGPVFLMHKLQPAEIISQLPRRTARASRGRHGRPRTVRADRS